MVFLMVTGLLLTVPPAHPRSIPSLSRLLSLTAGKARAAKQLDFNLPTNKKWRPVPSLFSIRWPSFVLGISFSVPGHGHPTPRTLLTPTPRLLMSPHGTGPLAHFLPAVMTISLSFIFPRSHPPGEGCTAATSDLSVPLRFSVAALVGSLLGHLSAIPHTLSRFLSARRLAVVFCLPLPHAR